MQYSAGTDCRSIVFLGILEPKSDLKLKVELLFLDKMIEMESEKPSVRDINLFVLYASSSSKSGKAGYFWH